MKLELALRARCAAADVLGHLRMRLSIRSSTSMVKVRTVPDQLASSGITLVRLPAWILVIDSTAASMRLLVAR